MPTKSNPLNPGHPPLNYPGAFLPKFRDSLSPDQDQSHHFAALFEIGVVLTPEIAKAVAISIDVDPKNTGDVGLGLAAGDLIKLVKTGKLDLSQIGNWILKNICNPKDK
jgi:hypothetical protein